MRMKRKSVALDERLVEKVRRASAPTAQKASLCPDISKSSGPHRVPC